MNTDCFKCDYKNKCNTDICENKICEYCEEKGFIKPIRGIEPYDNNYFQCSECDSTYTFEAFLKLKE